VSLFDTVADNVDAFVPCWQETLYNPGSATRSDVLNSAAVQLQCGRYVYATPRFYKVTPRTQPAFTSVLAVMTADFRSTNFELCTVL